MRVRGDDVRVRVRVRPSFFYANVGFGVQTPYGCSGLGCQVRVSGKGVGLGCRVRVRRQAEASSGLMLKSRTRFSVKI